MSYFLVVVSYTQTFLAFVGIGLFIISEWGSLSDVLFIVEMGPSG